MKNTAYPNFAEYRSTMPSYDLGKWMNAMRDIYIKTHLGASRNQAVEQIAGAWDIMERNAFLDWMRYYESGDMNKYKKAQHSYYVNDDINYFVPNPKMVPSPILNLNEQISNIPQNANIVSQKPEEISKEEKRKMIEEHRRKILGRLNSAEKLLSSQQGQFFAGQDFEKLLTAIYELKKQIQTVNKMSLSAQTIIDLIVRQANILNTGGYKNASDFMIKLAQNTPGDFSVNLGAIPAGGSQPDAGGSLGNPTVDLTQPAGGVETSNEKHITTDSAVGKFLENLDDSGLTTENDVDGESDKNADDDVEIDNDVILDQEIMPENENDLVVHAQAVPETKKKPAADPVPKANLEVESPARKDIGITPEEVKHAPEMSSIKDDFDALIDSAFSHLTVSDVVNKLEQVNKVFRNREISRQLAIVDVMLDHLGLAPYFPSLAEANNKQLEANQYCLTRIDDILSKLRGTMEVSKIDLTNEHQKSTPQSDAAKSILQQEETKEKQRKDVKKQLQDQSMLEKATKPQGEVEGVQQELAQPTQVEAPPAPKPGTI
jgi:hypothetical protein